MGIAYFIQLDNTEWSAQLLLRNRPPYDERRYQPIKIAFIYFPSFQQVFDFFQKILVIAVFDLIN